MPGQLPNPRHERFAVLVAQGNSGSESYRLAGFTVNSTRSAAAAASRLLTSPNVRDRVSELQAQATVDGLLTLEEKRKALAQIARDPETPLRERFKALDLDSKLAGHYPAAENPKNRPGGGWADPDTAEAHRDIAAAAELLRAGRGARLLPSPQGQPGPELLQLPPPRDSGDLAPK